MKRNQTRKISFLSLFLSLLIFLSSCNPVQPLITSEETKASTETLTKETAETAPKETEPDYTYTDSYFSRFFVKTANRGDTKRLVGKVLVNFFLITDDKTTWTDYDLRVLKGSHKIATARLLAEAKSYGVNLELKFNYVPCTISGVYDRDNSPTAQAKEAMRSVGYSTPNNVVNLLRREHGVDEVALLFCYNAPNRSFALPTADASGFEYAVLYGRDEDYRHELLHLFGARDFYLPPAIDTLANHYFPDSVMLSSNGRMDEFTAYLVGWRWKIGQKGAAFLESCKDLTADAWDEGEEENHFTGTKTVVRANGTYTGEFRNGIIFGKGKMVYNNGDVYEGDWQNGLRHGQGTLTKQNGEVQSGVWEYDKFKG